MAAPGRLVSCGLLALACGGRPESAAPAIAQVSTVAQQEASPSESQPEAVSTDASPDPTRAPDPPPTADAAGSCPEQDDPDIGLLISPVRPAAGAKLRILAATLSGESPLAVRVQTSQGDPIEVDVVHRGKVPVSALAAFEPESAGRLRVTIGRNGEGLRCATVRVSARASTRQPRQARPDRVWPIERSWSGAEEALYGAWLRELFHAERGEDLAFRALHEVTSRPERNVLHDHLGWGEDEPSAQGGLYMRPDCADAPYFYRAYYAWKRGLPFGFRQCSRGRGGTAPRCGALQGVLQPPAPFEDPDRPGELGVVQRFLRRSLAWGVHSGNGRTAHADDATDLYPLRLDRRALRPGAVYADPYGHTFVVVELFPPENKLPGVLYAVDAQPDGSITRKRFWEGNFLWNPDPALGGSGFKAFRPLVVEGDEGSRRLVALGNDAIASRPDYGDASGSQASLDRDSFYDLMERLITPGQRDPLVAQEEAVRALSEAAKVRVTSIENGERYHADHPGKVIPMPDGAAIFETTGAWENYSTPARDLRLLIAIDVVMGFDAKVARQPEAFGVSSKEQLEAVRSELAQARDRLLSSKDLGFSYARSDGSPVQLRLADLIERARAIEVGYNPNDCPEARWGAPADSAELGTCGRRAPAAQARKMEAYRVWFRERRRPPRGDPGPRVEPGP